MPEWLLIVPLLVLFGVAAGVAVSAEKRRGDALELAGRELGLAFLREGDVLPSQLHRLPFFQGGRARNILRGKAAGGELMVFDYGYATGVRGDRDPGSQREQTIAAFRFRDAALPAFELTRADILDRLASALRLGTIEFPDDPGFSRRFCLRGEDEPAVRAMFAPLAREHLAGLARKQRRTIEGRGEWMVVYRLGERVRPRRLAAFVAETSASAAKLAPPRLTPA